MNIQTDRHMYHVYMGLLRLATINLVALLLAEQIISDRGLLWCTPLTNCKKT